MISLILLNQIHPTTRMAHGSYVLRIWGGWSSIFRIALFFTNSKASSSCSAIQNLEGLHSYSPGISSSPNVPGWRLESCRALPPPWGTRRCYGSRHIGGLGIHLNLGGWKGRGGLNIRPGECGTWIKSACVFSFKSGGEMWIVKIEWDFNLHFINLIKSMQVFVVFMLWLAMVKW